MAVLLSQSAPLSKVNLGRALEMHMAYAMHMAASLPFLKQKKITSPPSFSKNEHVFLVLHIPAILFTELICPVYITLLCGYLYKETFQFNHVYFSLECI